MARRVIGSQIRDLLEDTDMRIVSATSDGEVVLTEGDSGSRELWQANDHFAGYVIEIEGVGYEFARGIT